MSERLTVPVRRVMTPVTTLAVVVALAAALALGLGARAWTEEASGSSAPSPSVVAPTHLVANPRDEAALRTTTAVSRAEVDVLPERRIGRPW